MSNQKKYFFFLKLFFYIVNLSDLLAFKKRNTTLRPNKVIPQAICSSGGEQG